MDEGKGMPFLVMGQGERQPLPISVDGKGPPFPVKGKGQEKGKRAALSPPYLGKGKGKRKGKAVPRHIVARMMNGRSIDLWIPCDALVRSARFEVARALGIHKARVRIAFDGLVLEDVRSIDACGLAEDAEVSIVIMSPLHGNLAESGVHVPDDVLEAKADLHEVLLADPRFRRIDA
jgi:hypothetical protein